jgi:hypothetical protein
VSARVVIGGVLAAALVLPVAVPPLGATTTATTPQTRADLTFARERQAAPPGWTVIETGAATELTWRSAEPIPVGDAALEFWAGDTRLGTPKPEADGTTFTLEVPGTLAGEVRTLRVTIGGVPVDASGDPRRTAVPGDETLSTTTRLPATQTSNIDPGKPGPYDTATAEYSLPGVQLTGLPVDVEMQGVVVRPTDAVGPRPLVLFLHGRHTS